MTRALASILAFVAVAVIPSGVAAQAPAAPAAATPGAPAATPPASAADPREQPTLRDDRESIDAGMKWLALIDSDKAGAAWDLASQQLKSAVARDKFVTAMHDMRKPLGKLASRTPERFARSHSMPGAPDGDYVIIEYKAAFSKGKLTEHLVWTLESGDVWRVAGYNYR